MSRKKTEAGKIVPLCRSKYQIFPPHASDRREALRVSITQHGVETPTTWDGQNNLIDGWERENICRELGTTCRREVRQFDSEAEKFQFILAVNAARRPSLSTKQKEEVIAGYLKGDPVVADNTLGDTLGVSKNTVLNVRRRLESSGEIRKVEKTRGKDGKCRPVKYAKRIIANTPKEFEKALNFIDELPGNCGGKTIDVTTARRRASREKSRKDRASRTAKSFPVPDSIQLYHCRFQELEQTAGVKPASVNAIVTDIPYLKAWLPNVTDLGRFAARVLVPGGLLLVMTGVQNIDDILGALKNEEELKQNVKLEMFWKGDAGCPCYLDAGIVVSYSKPIWVYSKGPFTRKGRFITPIGPYPQEKGWHPHQQPLDLFKHLVREFTDPGDLIVDTCGGGFTTAMAAYPLGRHCISCDTDEEAVKRGTERLNKAMRGEPDMP